MTNTPLRIPKPCSESWDSMTPATGGRHCAQCSKVVHDFSHSSPDEILAAMQASAQPICVRVPASMLAPEPAAHTPMRMLSPWRQVFLAALFVVFLAGGAVAQLPEEPQWAYPGLMLYLNEREAAEIQEIQLRLLRNGEVIRELPVDPTELLWWKKRYVLSGLSADSVIVQVNGVKKNGEHFAVMDTFLPKPGKVSLIPLYTDTNLIESNALMVTGELAPQGPHEILDVIPLDLSKRKVAPHIIGLAPREGIPVAIDPYTGKIPRKLRPKPKGQ